MKYFCLWKRIFPQNLTCVLVESKEAWSHRYGNIKVPFVHSISSYCEQKVLHYQWASCCQIMWKDIELTHHIDFPDDIFIDGTRMFFILKRAIVFVIIKAFSISTYYLCSVRHVIDSIFFNIWSRTDSLLGPVMNSACYEFGMGRLPQELAIRGAEGN